MKLRYKIASGLLIFLGVATASLALVVSLEDIEKPVPADDEVLVKVHAASVNPLDWHYMRGSPYIMRLGSGIGAPDDTSMGVDFAGTVESVGNNVTRFKPGDEVFGGRSGAFAEYVTVGEGRALVPKPANIEFEQAAAVPIAAIIALQALRDKGRVKPGQKVLSPQGIFVIVGGPKGNWLGPLMGPIKAKLLSPFVDQEFVMLLAQMRQDDLIFLADLMATGKVTPVIDRRYPLSEVHAAIEYSEAGHARGKIIISLE